MSEREWARAERVVCVRLDTLGDVLMTTPAIRALSRRGRRITLLTSSIGAEVATLVDEVDDVIVYDAPWLKATPARRDGAPDREMIRVLRARRFDAAVVFTVYTQSPLPAALLCHLADVPLRLAHARENPYGLLTDWVPEPEPDALVRHEVRRQLDLVATVGATVADDSLSLRVPAEPAAIVGARLRSFGLAPGGRWIVLHPGASAPARRYAPEGYAAAARMLADAGVTVVFSGSGAEIALVESVRGAMGAASFSLAGELGVAELAALLAAAPLLLSNNTGPVHIASAVGTPVVDLYALTNPQHTPWRVPARVLFHDVGCRWCLKSVCPHGHHDCLAKVAPAEVAAAVLELLEAPRARRAAAQVSVAKLAQGPDRV